MSAFGFKPSDYSTRQFTYEVWPDCWESWGLFCELSTQWRYSAAGGAAGLDYGPLFSRMDRMRLSDADWEVRFADVRVIESAVLDVFRESQKKHGN